MLRVNKQKQYDLKICLRNIFFKTWQYFYSLLKTQTKAYDL